MITDKQSYKKQNALEADVEACFKVDGLDWKH